MQKIFWPLEFIGTWRHLQEAGSAGHQRDSKIRSDVYGMFHLLVPCHPASGMDSFLPVFFFF